MRLGHPKGVRAGALAVAVALTACQLTPFAGTSPTSKVIGAALKPLNLTASTRGLAGSASLGTAPFSNAAVQVRRIDDDRLLGTATTGPDGAFQATLDPLPEPGTPLRVSATRDGRTLSALAFAGQQQKQAYRLAQTSAAGAFVALNPATTLALAAFLKRIKALSAQLTLPQTKTIALNALPFLLEAYEKAKLAAEQTLVKLVASAAGAPGAGPGGAAGPGAAGSLPDLGDLSPLAAKVLERFLDQLLTAVKPEGEITLPPDIVTAIAAPDSPLRQVAETVLTLLNEAAQVAAVEAQQSPPPSLAPGDWVQELPAASGTLLSPDPLASASGTLAPEASPSPAASATAAPASPTPTPTATASVSSGSSSSVRPSPTVPPAGFFVDLTSAVRHLFYSATPLAIPLSARPARFVFNGTSESGLVYLDTNTAATPSFDASPASYSAYPLNNHVRGIPRDDIGNPLATEAAHRLVAASGSVYIADANQVRTFVPGNATSLFIGGLDKVTDLAADASYLYVAEGGSGTQGGRVRRYALGNPDASATLCKGLRWPTAIAVNATHLYVTDYGSGHDGSVQRVRLADQTRQVLASGQPYPVSLAVASDTAFFTTDSNGATSLRAVSAPGGQVREFADLGSTVHPLLLADTTALYVVTTPKDTGGDWGTSRSSLSAPVHLLRIPATGGAPELLHRFANHTGPLGLHQLGSSVYVSFPNFGIKKVTP